MDERPDVNEGVDLAEEPHLSKRLHRDGDKIFNVLYLPRRLNHPQCPQSEI
jgi:hypothetical protein